MSAPIQGEPFRPETAADLIVSVMRSLGEAQAPLDGLLQGDCAAPDIFVADLVHFLTIMHGEMPSLLDVVSDSDPDVRDVVAAAADAVRSDRRWLTKLSVRVGTVVDLSGLSEAETAVRSLRDGMLTLAASQRSGCGLGAALAFLASWPGLRAALNRAGVYAFSMRWPAPPQPWSDEMLSPLAAYADRQFATPAVGRALAFGAAQCAQMHGQLIELVYARALSR